MDIRDTYYNMTGDYEGAYGRNNDDRGDYIYSDDSLMRSIEALQGTQNFGERNAIGGMIDALGPRAGAYLGGAMADVSPQSGYWGVNDYISDFMNAKADAMGTPDPAYKTYEGGRMGYGDMAKAAGGALSEVLNPSPTRSLGARYGLIEYLGKKLLGSK